MKPPAFLSKSQFIKYILPAFLWLAVVNASAQSPAFVSSANQHSHTDNWTNWVKIHGSDNAQAGLWMRTKICPYVIDGKSAIDGGCDVHYSKLELRNDYPEKIEVRLYLSVLAGNCKGGRENYKNEAKNLVDYNFIEPGKVDSYENLFFRLTNYKLEVKFPDKNKTTDQQNITQNNIAPKNPPGAGTDDGADKSKTLPKNANPAAGGVRADNVQPVGQSVVITNGGKTDEPKQQATNEKVTQAPTLQQVSQQNADNYLKAVQNSTDELQKAAFYNLAKINATVGGNKAQQQQIQQAQTQQTNRLIENSVNSITNLMNVIAEQNATAARLSALNSDHAATAEIYDLVNFYTHWYADSTFSILSQYFHGDQAAIGEPDWITTDVNRCNECDTIPYLNSIKEALNQSDGYKLSRIIEPRIFDPTSMHTDDNPFRSFTDNMTGDENAVMKKEGKRADNGQLEALLNMMMIYAEGRTSEYGKDLKKFDNYFYSFLKHKDIQNGNINKSKIFTVWYIEYYASLHSDTIKKSKNKEDVKQLLGYLKKCDSLISLPAYNNPGNILYKKYAMRYQPEFFYTDYANIKSGEMELYSLLYELTDDPAEKKQISANIIGIYKNVLVGLSPIFNSPAMKKPFTRDGQWRVHHGYPEN